MNEVALGEIADFQNGRAFKPSQWGSRGLPIIRIQNLTGTSQTFNCFDGVTDDRIRITKGDILISWSASLGVFVWSGSDAVLNQHIFKVSVHDGVDKEYFYFAAMAVLTEMASHVHGSTMQHITKDRFEALTINLPNQLQQRRIAQRLSQIDRMRRMRRYALELSEGLLGAAIDELGVKDWASLALEDCCTRITDGTHQTPQFCKAGVPFIFVKNVRNGNIDFATDNYVSPEEFAVLSRRCAVESGDILYTIVGATYGQAAIVGRFVKFAFQRHLAHLKPDRSVVEPEYLAAVMQLPIVKRQADSLARGAAQPTVNLKELRTFRVPVPTKATQTRIVRIVRKLRSQHAIHVEGLRQAEHLFQTLLHEAFAEA